MLRKLRRTLTENLGIKLASLLLALLVYAHVYSQQDQVSVLQIPLVVEGLPRGLTYRGEVPPSIHVRIRARGGELLKLRTQTPRAVIRLADPKAGQLQRPVTTEDVVLPPESDARVEAVTDPVVLSLNIEPVLASGRPIAVPLRGVPSDGFTRYGPVRVWPETLAVTGPAGQVAALDSIRTEEVDLNGRSETVGETVHFQLPAGLRARTDRVSVHIPIVPELRRTYGPLRVTLPPEMRASWIVEPDSVRVRLAGPAPMVEPISASQLRPRAVPPELGTEEEVVLVQVALPPSLRSQVQVEAVEPSTVTLVRRKR